MTALRLWSNRMSRARAEAEAEELCHHGYAVFRMPAGNFCGVEHDDAGPFQIEEPHAAKVFEINCRTGEFWSQPCPDEVPA